MTTVIETAQDTLEEILSLADTAFDLWAQTSRGARARALNAVADGLDAVADELVSIAQAETHLLEGRLRGELKRTTFQLRLFAAVLTEGSYLDARIDHADPGWPMGAPRPDLRRILEPIGPVVVFAASNFPFAFSVAGGDTAAALAAGCPVVLKAHSGHLELSRRTGELVADALDAAGAPRGLFSMIFGTAPGRAAVQDPRIKAGSFTGSIPGGRTLFDLANSRPEPIPFYGELGSVNPVFVTEQADAARAGEIAEQFLASMTLGAGQFCTKPGVLFVPERSRIPAALRGLALPAPAPLLNERIQGGYIAVLDELLAQPEITVLVKGDAALADPPSPTILQTSIHSVLANRDEVFRECFGPTALIVTYRRESDLLELARAIDGQLTATIFGEGDEGIVPELVLLLAKRAGRLLWNQWPTGVSVTYAQQHGGPYPATTAPGTTSVGTAAITRFLRPVAYQGFPQELLPGELADHPEAPLPRRIDGQLTA
jgi:NADP-dependent aldehyde dehydrogenase